jgi:hypothetical protein
MSKSKTKQLRYIAAEYEDGNPVKKVNRNKRVERRIERAIRIKNIDELIGLEDDVKN